MLGQIYNGGGRKRVSDILNLAVTEKKTLIQNLHISFLKIYGGKCRKIGYYMPYVLKIKLLNISL